MNGPLLHSSVLHSSVLHSPEWLLLGVLPWLLVPLALRAEGVRWLWLAALPVLLMALWLPLDSQLALPWLLLGSQLLLDSEARSLLLVAALLWLVAGWYAGHWRVDHNPLDNAAAGRFRACFLLAMGGNFGVILSADLISFYLCFSVMGLAAYGLVVHGGQPAQRRAGRVYLIMTLLGEMALFTAFVLIYQRTGTLTPTAVQLVEGSHWQTGLLVLAFGVKAGLGGLHFWLPLAHPAAPVPASAVLSGAMIKTALVGWLHFLPLGEQALPIWGALLLTLGAVAALLAVLVGLLQQNPKVVLAYSSISKMGLLVALLGLALMLPGQAAALTALIVLFAVHHGLAKGALFLGVGLVKHSASRAVIWWLLLPALALSAAPLTSGAQIKTRLTGLLQTLEASGAELLLWLLVASAVATPLLLARFFWLLRTVRRQQACAVQQWLPWAMLVTVLLALPLLNGQPAQTLISPAGLLLALLLTAWLCWRQPGWLCRWTGRIPAGDVAVLLSVADCWHLNFTRHSGKPASGVSSPPVLAEKITALRQRLPRSDADVGLYWLGVIVGLLLVSVA